jgi:hypothetical protein
MNPIKLFIGKYQLLLTAIVVGVLLAALGVQTVRLSSAKTDFAQLETSIAQERQANAKQRADDERTARTTEQQLADAAATERKAAREKERVLASRVADLRDQLRNRPERPAAGSPVAADACTPGCGTGAGLYRADADVAVWFAASAARHAQERDECRSQYNAAREALKRQAK